MQTKKRARGGWGLKRAALEPEDAAILWDAFLGRMQSLGFGEPSGRSGSPNTWNSMVWSWSGYATRRDSGFEVTQLAQYEIRATVVPSSQTGPRIYGVNFLLPAERFGQRIYWDASSFNDLASAEANLFATLDNVAARYHSKTRRAYGGGVDLASDARDDIDHQDQDVHMNYTQETQVFPAGEGDSSESTVETELFGAPRRIEGAIKVPNIVNATLFCSTYDREFEGQDDEDAEALLVDTSYEYNKEDVDIQTLRSVLNSSVGALAYESNGRWTSVEFEQDYLRNRKSEWFLEITGETGRLTEAQYRLLNDYFRGVPGGGPQVSYDEIVEGGEHEGVVIPKDVGDELFAYLGRADMPHDHHVTDTLQDILAGKPIGAGSIRLVSRDLQRLYNTTRKQQWVDNQGVVTIEEDPEIKRLLQVLEKYLTQSRNARRVRLMIKEGTSDANIIRDRMISVLTAAREHVEALQEQADFYRGQLDVTVDRLKAEINRGSPQVVQDRTSEQVDMLATTLQKMEAEVKQARGKADLISIDLQTLNRYGPENVENISKYANTSKHSKTARAIVVTIPKGKLEQIKAEEADVAQRESSGEIDINYYWTMGRLPTEVPERIYFLWDGAVRAYHDVTGIDREKGLLYMSTAIHEMPAPMPMKGFRGFRYMKDMPTGRVGSLTFKPVAEMGGSSLLELTVDQGVQDNPMTENPSESYHGDNVWEDKDLHMGAVDDGNDERRDNDHVLRDRAPNNLIPALPANPYQPRGPTNPATLGTEPADGDWQYVPDQASNITTVHDHGVGQADFDSDLRSPFVKVF